MKTIVLTLTLLLSTGLWAKSYSCNFESEGSDGTIAVDIKGKLAGLSLKHGSNNKSYKNCKTEKDDFGLLIDCSGNELDLDLMVLVNEQIDSTSGGIMSSTYDLFVDLDC